MSRINLKPETKVTVCSLLGDFQGVRVSSGDLDEVEAPTEAAAETCGSPLNAFLPTFCAHKK